jgi:plasmid stabilization system protein ParE
MPRTVSLHPDAQQDIDASAAWYAERSARAAIRFLDELDHLIDRIADAPTQFPMFNADLRRAIFHRFPFYIVFRVTEARITVLAVAHGKRRHGFWRDRG